MGPMLLNMGPKPLPNYLLDPVSSSGPQDLLRWSQSLSEPKKKVLFRFMQFVIDYCCESDILSLSIGIVFFLERVYWDIFDFPQLLKIIANLKCFSFILELNK